MGAPMMNQACRDLNTLAESKGWPLRCDSASAFEDARLMALNELWCLKAGDGVPARSAFDLRSLQPYAKHIVILERDAVEAERRYRFRLFGSAHTLLFGDHTGRYLEEMVSPDLLPSWLAFYDTVLLTRRPLKIVTRFRIKSGDFLEGEIFAAPMRDEAGLERQILAATFIDLRRFTPSPFG